MSHPSVPPPAEPWHPMLKPLVELSDALRRYCQAGSEELWQPIPELWQHAARLQGDLASVQKHADLLFMLPAARKSELLASKRVFPSSSEPVFPVVSASSEQWPPPKVADDFLGRSCDTIDCRLLGSFVGAEKSLLCSDHFNPSSQQPLILRNLVDVIFPPGRTWNFDTLVQRSGDAVMHGVRKAACGTTNFSYADANRKAYDDPSTAEIHHPPMALRDVIRGIREAGPCGSSYYLWAPLFHGSEVDGEFRAEGSELANNLSACGVEQIRWAELDAIAKLGSFGSIHDVQLFVSGAHAVTTCHYDSSQNIFLQLGGAKRFLLFAPMVGAKALAPFPIMHARDRHARAQLNRPNYELWPQLLSAKNSAVEAILGPGDGLFLPYGWWHHVESLLPENVSINFWFRGGLLANRPPQKVLRPFPEAVLVDLAREVEGVLARCIGQECLGMFLLWLRSNRAVCRRGVPPAGCELTWLRYANYVQIRLAELLDPGDIAHVFEALDGSRFLGLDVQAQPAVRLRTSSSDLRWARACCRKWDWPHSHFRCAVTYSRRDRWRHCRPNQRH